VNKNAAVLPQIVLFRFRRRGKGMARKPTEALLGGMESDWWTILGDQYEHPETRGPTATFTGDTIGLHRIRVTFIFLQHVEVGVWVLPLGAK
jgi:hypothetical protein